MDLTADNQILLAGDHAQTVTKIQMTKGYSKCHFAPMDLLMKLGLVKCRKIRSIYGLQLALNYRWRMNREKGILFYGRIGFSLIYPHGRAFARLCLTEKRLPLFYDRSFSDGTRHKCLKSDER